MVKLPPENSRRIAKSSGVSEKSVRRYGKDADKRKAILTLLEDEKWSQWSNNVIANQCGVSHTMVNNIRSSLETVSSQKRKYADGRTIDTSNIGKSKLPDNIDAETG